MQLVEKRTQLTLQGAKNGRPRILVHVYVQPQGHFGHRDDRQDSPRNARNRLCVVCDELFSRLRFF